MADENISGIKYLEQHERSIIDRILKLAENANDKDGVKLKANQILLNKLFPDKTRHDIEFLGKSPFEIITESLNKEKERNVS